jgi:ABC-type Na+ efflux pump permease subunit
MPDKKLKRYGLEKAAKILIVVGLLLILISWIMATYYLIVNPTTKGGLALLSIPIIFTAVAATLLLVIKYRYTLFEKYPYLMNLPSIFYHLGERKDTKKQSTAFNMIFTVHSLVIAFLGLMSLLLTVSIGSSIRNQTNSPFFYLYFVVIAALIASVILIYRRIYVRLRK